LWRPCQKELPFLKLQELGSAQLEVYLYPNDKGEPIDELDYFDKIDFKKSNVPLVYVVANNGK
jgi:hypothetical protein